MKIILKGGLVINPAENTAEIKDILIDGNIITKIAENIEDKVDKIIFAHDKWVSSGLIDVHVHLREPGFEYKETIETGAKSAAVGGFTTICAMPNTKPSADCVEVIEFINKKSEKAIVNVLPIGAITKGLNSEEISDIAGMAKAGICAVSDDGRTVKEASLLKAAMYEASEHGLTVLSHCEDLGLTGCGQVNEGEVADAMNLQGISNDSESVIVARDIMLAISAKSKIHICHVSAVESVQIIKFYKGMHDGISAEVTPHHFTLTDKDVLKCGTSAKMSPPLRAEKDVLAIKEALKDGTIEIIATDHAPHSFEEKHTVFEKAPNGIVGLETALPLAITELVNTGILTPIQLIAKMSYNPAKMLGINKGILEIGAIADIVVIDPNIEYEIDISKFKSKSKNSPFNGRKVKGKVFTTIVSGNIVVENYEFKGLI